MVTGHHLLHCDARWGWLRPCTLIIRVLLKGGANVAKKRQRYVGRRKRVYHPPTTPLDKHHLCFIGRRWNNGWLASFRKYWYCIVKIPRDTIHRYIHENLATISPPSPENAKAALEQLWELNKYGAIHDTDSIERRLEVLIALFDCVEPKTTEGFRKQLELIREYRHSWWVPI